MTYLPLQPPSIQNGVQDSHYRYREYKPGKHLTSYVACYWTLEFQGNGHSKSHRIIPDGCVDMIFDLKAQTVSQAALVAGLMTAYETMDLTRNQSVFGIRFFSDQARRFFKHPVSELGGGVVFLEDVLGKEAALIVEKVQAANDVSEIIEQVELVLSNRLPNDDMPADRLLQSAMRIMYANQGIISVRSLAEKLSYSERNVSRVFRTELGVGPKELLGIIQFQCLLGELYRAPNSRLTDVAVKYGYFDQSHFIHSFKRLYGLSPVQLFK